MARVPPWSKGITKSRTPIGSFPNLRSKTFRNATVNIFTRISETPTNFASKVTAFPTEIGFGKIPGFELPDISTVWVTVGLKVGVSVSVSLGTGVAIEVWVLVNVWVTVLVKVAVVD